MELVFNKGWIPTNVLNHWIKSGYVVRIYTAVGSKIEGKIKGYDNYNYTFIDDEGNKCLINKAQIFFIRRLKKE